MIDKKSPLYVVCFIAMICLVFGLGISVVYNATADVLKKNETLHRNRVVCNAFMLNVKDNPESYEFAFKERVEFTELVDGNLFRNFYRLVGSEEELIGFDFAGMGFWDRIVGILVLSKDLKQIMNIQFFEQKETPGLGARIEEEWFTDQFKGVDIDWKESVSNRVVIKSSSGSYVQNQIDAIAGATQTSMALKRILNNELEHIRKLFLREALSDE